MELPGVLIRMEVFDVLIQMKLFGDVFEMDLFGEGIEIYPFCLVFEMKFLGVMIGMNLLCVLI
jgi:hypothetical protein